LQLSDNIILLCFVLYFWATQYMYSSRTVVSLKSYVIGNLAHFI